MCHECTWHHKTFLVQSVYWHLAINIILYTVLYYCCCYCYCGYCYDCLKQKVRKQLLTHLYLFACLVYIMFLFRLFYISYFIFIQVEILKVRFTFLFVSVFLSVSVCLSVSLSVCLSVCLCLPLSQPSLSLLIHNEDVFNQTCEFVCGNLNNQVTLNDC